MSSPGTPLPAASFPIPPPLGKVPLVDLKTGIATTLGISFFTEMWAAIQGSGGTAEQIAALQALVAILFGMHGDATITADGTITVVSSQGHSLFPFAWQPQGSLPGKPSANQQIFKLPTNAGNFLPTDLAGSFFNCDAAPTADTTFNFFQNASNIGSVKFAAATTTGVATFTETTFAADDLFSMISPAVPDATFSGLSFLILGTRTQ